MNSIQSPRYKAYSLALAHLAENQSITESIPAFQPIYTSAKATLDAIKDASNRKTEKQKGFTVSKQELQEALSGQAKSIASVIATYASINNDTGLKEAMSFSKSELLYGSDEKLEGKATIIYKKAEEYADKLKDYGISRVLLDNLKNLLETYSATLNEPRSLTVERKQAGSDVEKLFKQLGQILSQQLDPLVALFAGTQPKFVEQYQLKRQIVNPARRKSKVAGLIKVRGSGKPLSGAVINMKAGEISTLSNEDGSYTLKTPVGSNLELVIEKEGYLPVTVVVSVKRGQTTVIDIEMELLRL
jgi:Carboxypeptidase regulatory-like domain